MHTLASAGFQLAGPAADLQETSWGGILILSSRAVKNGRRVLFANSYGGPDAWYKIKSGLLPPHHLWGCVQLAQMGYEVALAEPIPHFSIRKEAFPHDLKLFRFIQSWLHKDDILFAGHTVLHWLALLKKLTVIRCRLVTLTYAREDLAFARAHTGIVALTPAAADEARIMAPRVKTIHLGWGVDLSYFPQLAYNPKWLLMCGRTHRDHKTLADACFQFSALVRVIAPQLPQELRWPDHVSIKTGGAADDTVSYSTLLNEYYANTSASLIVLKSDPGEKTAVGFTNLIEAMAMSRPVIATKTGALAGELDLNASGAGIYVQPGNASQLADAMKQITNFPNEARKMGQKGRALCEAHYNIERFSRGLHHFFNSL